MNHIPAWRERAGLAPDYEVHSPSSVEKALLDEVADLRKQRQQDAVDAARYRVLRAGRHVTLLPPMTVPFTKGQQEYLPEGLDRACDKAIQWERDTVPPQKAAISESVGS